MPPLWVSYLQIGALIAVVMFVIALMISLLKS